MDFRVIFHFTFVVFILFLSSSSEGYKFYVGGKDGWVLNPTESYSHWAGRNRFQVNDTLLFKQKKGEETVLLVTRDNYNTCNVKTPINSLTDEESLYKFTRSGPHYFISGNVDHCNKGQKLTIVVLAVRPPPPMIPPPPTAPATFSPPPPPPASEAPTPSPSAEDGPSSSDEKNKESSSGGIGLKSSLLGVVVGVSVSVSVVLGGFGCMV